LRILGGAAAEGKTHGDEGVIVALHEPSFDAAGARDALYLHGGDLNRLRGRNDERRDRQPCTMPQQEGRNPEGTRHEGYDLPFLAGAWAGFSPMLLVYSGVGSR